MDRIAVHSIARQIAQAADPLVNLEDLIVPTLERIGRLWEEGKVSLSQVYMAGRLCEGLIEPLTASRPDAAGAPAPLAVATLDDYHLLGRQMVCSALRSAGYSPANYGRVTLDELLTRLRADRPSVLLVSVLMLPSALKVKQVVTAIRQEGLPTRVIVGGAPFRLAPFLAAEVEADAVGTNAASAVSLVRSFLEVPA
jgi:methanogenic corrinoid protein MtbC1